MTRVLATYADGRTLSWEDGKIDGSGSLVLAAPGWKGRGVAAATMPESEPVSVDGYEKDPQAFIALTRFVHPKDDAPKLEVDGDVGWPEPPPETAD